MYAQLTKLIIITCFGRGAHRPFFNAILRITLAVIGSSLLGVALAKSLAGADIASGLPNLLLGAGIITVAFATTGFVLLSAASSMLQDTKSPVRRLLIILPLARSSRWLVLVLPLLIMDFILLCLYVPLAIGLSISSGASIFACVASVILGTMASTGFVLMRFKRLAFLKIISFILMVTTMVWLVDSALKSMDKTTSTLLLTSVFIIPLLGCLGFLQSYRYLELTGRVKSEDIITDMVPTRLVAPFWFVIKTLRNRRALVALGFCLFVSLSLAFGLHFRQQINLAGAGWLLFGSVLACSFASDMRGLSRRYKTPEVVALKGVPYFMLHQLGTALFLNSLIVSPLLFVVVLASPLPLMTVLFYSAGIVIAGTVLGLLSSTLFVPQNGEIGSQIFTALFAFIGLFGLPRVLRFSDQGLAAQAVYWLGIAVACFVAALIIEQIRRRNYIHAGA